MCAHRLADPVETELPSDLTPRETELLRRAGQRVFILSRKLADATREIDRVRTQLSHLTELLGEARRMRDVLGDQVRSLQRERDRDYEERAELRKLLASMQLFMTSVVSPQSRLHLLETRAAPQRGAAQLREGNRQ